MGFGVHIPTCIEGMMYPVPFAKPSDILPTALLCERLGFDSVWGNDHMTTQRYVQKEFSDPPNFFEPLITFSYCAARTTSAQVRHRHHRAAHAQHAGARQAGGHAGPALGRASDPRGGDGRLPRGVRGAVPRRARRARAATIVDEGMQALRLLFTERRATFRGAHGALRGRRVLPEAGAEPHADLRRAATIPRCGAAPGSTRRAGCPRCCRPRRSSGAWPMSIGPRPRPDGTGRRSTSRRSSRSRSGAPTTRRSGASEPRSSSSISSR